MARVKFPEGTIIHKEKNFFKRLKLAIYGKKSLSECILYTIVFIVFAAVAGSYLLILIWNFISGLKTSDDALLNPFGIAQGLHFVHYVEVFEFLKVGKNSFWEMIMNSMIFSIVGQVMTMYFTTTLAFVATKYKFFGHKFFWYASFFMNTIPLYGSGGQTYTLYSKLGFINSYSILLLNTAALGLGFMYFESMYQSMSNTYFEAADIDGANDWHKCYFIAIPLSMSLISALFIMNWMSAWNAYGGAIIYHPKIPTFAAGIYLFQLQMRYGARADILYAACFIACIPPLILFISFNKVLLNNVSLGGIKE